MGTLGGDCFKGCVLKAMKGVGVLKWAREGLKRWEGEYNAGDWNS